MLEAAETSLKTLNKNDITEVKAMRRPPVGVLLVIEAMCIINDVKPNKVCIYIITQKYYKVIISKFQQSVFYIIMHIYTNIYNPIIQQSLFFTISIIYLRIIIYIHFNVFVLF